MIIEESTKSCIDPTSFHENFFLQKSTDGLGVSIKQKKAEGSTERFRKKSFSYKFVESTQILVLC